MTSENTAPASAEPAQVSSITFDDLGLSEPTLRAVKETGYNTPTPIQAAAIPEVLKGRDVLGIWPIPRAHAAYAHPRADARTRSASR
jgi:ATP-dependent RNA helicase DeaD